MTDERVTIFIDGSNLFHGLIEDFDNIGIDLERLANKILGVRKLGRVYYYASLPNKEDNPEKFSKQQRFFNAIQRLPYFKVIIGRIEKHGDSYVEKGVDVTLAVDMLDLAFANVYDTAIIVSGDADFSHAVEVAQRLGKHVENVTSKGCQSRQLSDTCDISLILDNDYLQDCWRA